MMLREIVTSRPQMIPFFFPVGTLTVGPFNNLVEFSAFRSS